MAATFERIGGALVGAWILVALSTGLVVAQQPCGEATVGSCYSKYTDIVALTRTDDGFAAIGKRADGIDLMRLSSNAELRRSTALTLPPWMGPDEISTLTIEKLVNGPKGWFLFVGWVSTGPKQNQRQSSLLGLVNPDNEVIWTAPITFSADTSTILYSAVYDAEHQRYLAVGRYTNGADNGKCAFWSQALIVSVPETGLPNGGFPIAVVQQSGQIMESRAALYDIQPTGTPGEFVAAGFGTAQNESGKGCQDNAMAVQVSAANNGLNVGPPYFIGLKDANEVAFSIADIGDGRYMLAGYGVKAGSQARAALLASFAFGKKPATRADAYPRDDKSGGDRYRVIVPLKTVGTTLAAGSASEGKNGRNQGIWTITPNSLDPAGSTDYLTRGAGSDIVDAALGPDGRVLGVGSVTGAGGEDMGWLGFIFEQRFTAKRRQPDKSLQMLTEAEETAGWAALSEREIAAGAGLRSKGARQGSEFELRVSFTAETDVTATAFAAAGDLDLALIDASGKMVAFSSNLNDAGEYLRAKLPAGDYKLKAIATSDVGEYELRLKKGDGSDEMVLSKLSSLDPTGRAMLSGLLENNGYDAAANPAIGFGGGTARSVLAFYNTFQSSADEGAVEQFIANASLGGGSR